MKVSEFIKENVVSLGAKEYYNKVNNSWDIESEIFKKAILEEINEYIKPSKIKTINDVAKLLNNNTYGDELDNPYNIDVEDICCKNKWVILFPYSDDNLEIRGYINDEIGAYDGGDYQFIKKGEFIKDLEEYNTYHKAEYDQIIDSDNDNAHIFVKWCLKDTGYIWYIDTDYTEVAYFDIISEDDEDNEKWARCCIIDCSNIL